MKVLDKKIYRLNPDCDSARLLEIVRVNNEAITRGERCPVCLGHTPTQEATDYLTIDVGEAKNFRCDGEFILCEIDIDDAFAEAVKRHRGVSVELWSDNRLFPISLLAHNRPALELEPVKYSREGDHSTATITEPEEDENMDASAIKEIVSECLMASDLTAQIKSLADTVGALSLQVQEHGETQQKLQWLFDEEQGEEGEEGEGAEGEAAEPVAEKVAEDVEVESGEHPELPPEEIEQIAEDHVAEGKEEEPEPNKPEVEEKNELGMALPSGTNTFVPGTAGAKKDEEEPAKPKKKNYEELALESETYRLAAENQATVAAGYATQLQAIAEEKTAAATRVAELERKYQMLERKNELIVLSQRYQFDAETEMAVVQAMTPEQYETHKKLVVTRYAMPPVHSAKVNVGELPKPAKDEGEVIPSNKVLAVTKYALSKGITWAAAAKEMGVKK